MRERGDIRGERRRHSDRDICYMREGGNERGGETGERMRWRERGERYKGEME